MAQTEVIRRAIDLWLEQRYPALKAWKAERAFIEERMAQGPVPGGRTWTREEIYEERLNRYGRDAG